MEKKITKKLQKIIAHLVTEAELSFPVNVHCQQKKKKTVNVAKYTGTKKNDAYDTCSCSVFFEVGLY